MHGELLQWHSWKQGVFSSTADAIWCAHRPERVPNWPVPPCPCPRTQTGTEELSPNFWWDPPCLLSSGCETDDLNALSHPVCKH